LALEKRDAHPIGKRLISARTAQQVTRMMEMAVGPGGTAPLAAIPGYRVAGKTGTAYKAEQGGYAEHKYRSSFVGFAPASSPRFIVAVMIDEPQGAHHFGGDVGAPVFASVMNAALRMTSVPPDAPATLAPGTLNVQAQPTRDQG
jgi:cell division protein FtsI (penicillin-binding protein 3)